MVLNVQDDTNLTIRLHKVCAILNDLNAVKKCVISLKKPLHISNDEKHSALRCCMHQWRDSDFRYISQKAFCSPLLHASVARQCILKGSPRLDVAACISRETVIFGI